MKRSWKRILAGFMAACIIFGDSSLVYAAESTQPVVEASETEVIDETLDEEIIEEVVEQETLEEETVAEEETDVEEITDEESTDVEESTDAEESETEDLSDEETEAEDIVQDSLDNEMNVVEPSEEAVNAATTNSEAPETSVEEPEIIQISAHQEVFVNPLYKDVVSEEDILNSVSAVMPADELDIYTNDTDIVKMVREGLVARNASITFAYEYEGTYDKEYVMGLVASYMDDAMEHTGNPKEGDYIKWNYAGDTRGISSGYSQGDKVHVELFYSILYYTSAEMEAEMDEAVDSLMNSLQLSDLAEYEQIRGIYDYICENVVYDYANLKDEEYKLKYTPYAALINKTAVCQGYATLFYRMALETGLDARVITGDAGGAHAWNIVELDNQYYNLDSTWDAGESTYSYFLKNMDDFTDHVRDEEYSSESFMAAYPMSESAYVEEDFEEEETNSFILNEIYNVEASAEGQALNLDYMFAPEVGGYYGIKGNVSWITVYDEEWEELETAYMRNSEDGNLERYYQLEADKTYQFSFSVYLDVDQSGYYQLVQDTEGENIPILTADGTVYSMNEGESRTFKVQSSKKGLYKLEVELEAETGSYGYEWISTGPDAYTNSSYTSIYFSDTSWAYLTVDAYDSLTVKIEEETAMDSLNLEEEVAVSSSTDSCYELDVQGCDIVYAKSKSRAFDLYGFDSNENCYVIEKNWLYESYTGEDSWAMLSIPSDVERIIMFFDCKGQHDDETILVTESYQFEKQLEKWSGTITVPANAEALFEYNGAFFGDLYICEPSGATWEDAYTELIYTNQDINQLWNGEVLDGTEYRGFSNYYFDCVPTGNNHIIFSIQNNTTEELTFQLKTNEDFEIWELYDDNSGLIDVSLNENYWSNSGESYFSYYKITPETTKMYDFNDAEWIYRLSDHRFMPRFCTVLESGETYLVRLRDVYGIPTRDILETTGTSVEFSDGAYVQKFIPTTSGDYTIEVDGNLYLWNQEELCLENITDRDQIALEEGECYIFLSYGDGKIGASSKFMILDYDFLHAFIASGGSVSLNADGSLEIEQRGAGWNLISKIASFLGLITYEEVSKETYIEANNYWVNEEHGSFVPTEYYDLDGNDISGQEVEDGGYVVVKYEPEYVWVDRFEMEVGDEILTAGESTTLNVTPYAATEKYGFKDDPEVRIMTSNPEIADILPDGTIETYKAGTVVITAYADETLKRELGLEDTIVSKSVTITVEPKSEDIVLEYTGTVQQDGDGEVLYIRSWEMNAAGVPFTDENILSILNKRINDGDSFARVFIIHNQNNQGVVNKDVWNAVKALMSNSEQSAGFSFPNEYYMDENWFITGMQTAAEDVVLDATLTLGAAGEYGNVVFGNTDIPAESADIRFNTTHWNDGTSSGEKDDYARFVAAFGTESSELDLVKNGTVVEDTSVQYKYYSDNSGTVNLNLCVDFVNGLESNVTYELTKKIAENSYTGSVDGDCLYIRHWEVENNGGTFDDAAILNALQSWDRTFDQIMICYPANYSTTIPVDIWNAVKELQDSVDSSNGFLFDGGMEMNIGWFVANMETADAPVKLDASVTIGGSECYGTVTVEDTIDIPANAHVRFEASKWKDDGGEIEKNDYQDIVDVFGQEYLEFDLMLDDQIIEERSDRYEWYKSEDGEHYNINADICLDNVERLEDGTYQMVSKQEDSDDGSDEEVDDDTFVLNKVYSTGTSDEWQDLYYTYYFTPEEDGYYGVKGMLYSIHVYDSEYDWIDPEYCKNYVNDEEQYTIPETYYYLNAGETYKFELNIEVSAGEEKTYKLVRDTEGDTSTELVIDGEAYNMQAGEERLFVINHSTPGYYECVITGGNYNLKWHDIGTGNDYADDWFTCVEPGACYVWIQAQDDLSVQMCSVETHTLALNTEVNLNPDKMVSYEVDVEGLDLLYVKCNSYLTDIIGTKEDNSAWWVSCNAIHDAEGAEGYLLEIPEDVNKIAILVDGTDGDTEKTILVTDTWVFEETLENWSGSVKVPANSSLVFEYKGKAHGDYYISQPVNYDWSFAEFSDAYHSDEVNTLWDVELLDGTYYKGYSSRHYYAQENMEQTHLIFTLWNYTEEELTFELKTNEDFDTWELYDEGDGHTEVDINDNYYDYDYSTNFSYYRFVPESTELYNVHSCHWIYRVSDHKLMPEYNVILEAGEEYLIRFYDTYGLETINAEECSGTDVRFTELEPVKIFTPTVSGDYYIEVPGTLKLWNNETLSFDNITTKEKIALEAGETYIFWARNGEGQIGLKNDITVLDYDYYQALIASGGSVSIVDGVLQIKEPIFGGFTLKEALLSLLGLGAYREQPREAFMKANQYWVGETGTFAASEYYRLSADGTLTDCADDSVTAGDILVVKYEPEIVWVDSMEVSVDKTVLSEGETAQISVEVAPATEKYDFKGTPEIRFESSDSEIAEVDSNGVVTPHGTGKVTITVYADEDLRYQEGLEDQILSQSIELTVTGEEFTVLDYDFLQAFIASGGSVSLNADGSLKIEQKSAGWNLISKIASFFGITIYKDIPTENYVEANHYWVNEKDGSFIPTGYYDLDGNDISEQEVKAGGYAIVKYEPEYVWVDHLDMEVEDDVLTAGESTTLTVTPYAATEKYGFNSEPEIRLVSTNPEIADILPDGTIETYKAGTVLIRAYADVAAKHALGISDTVVSDYVVITVEPAPITFAYEILDDGTACITGYEGSPSKVIEIPSEIDGYPVTAIGELAFLDCTDLENVTLPDSIESIHYLAFKHLEDDYYMNLDVLFYASKGSYAYEWAKSEGYKVMDPTEGPYAFIYEDNGDETITITDYVGDLPSVLSIPSTIDGYEVTGIGSGAFMGCTEITELVIPDSVSTIESHAISHCDNLEEVIIPNSVITIAEYGIFNCLKLKEVQLPNSIESIGEFTFYQGDLEEDSETYERMDITIYASRKYYAYEWANDRGFTVVDSEENPYEFAYQSADENPDTWRITGLDNGTATGNLVIPETIDGIKVTEVSGLSADNFNGEFVGTLTLPSTLRVIHDNAFQGNEKLTGTVVIPSDVTYVGTDAFEGTALTIKVECEENSYLHDWAREHGYEYEIVRYVCDNFVYEVLEDNTAKILGCKEFDGDTLTIPAKLNGHAVSEIGDYAFENYENLCELRLECEETLKLIGNYAFRNCSSMWSFEIPENVVSIGDGAFYGTSDWWILEIPESVTSIGKEAFGNVGSIYRVYLSDKVTSIGENAFTTRNYNEDNKENILLYCAKGSYAYNWASKNGYNIYDTTAEREYQLTYTVLDEEAKTAAITGYTGEAGGTLTIPSTIDGYTVVEIADDAFDAEQNMEEDGMYGDSINFTGLELPDTLVRIGDQAFQSCKGLTGSLVIPDSVKEIGAIAFGWCNRLSGALIIPDTVEKIGSNAFNCCTGFTSLSLGTGLSQIEYYTFANCRNITGELVIPENITNIADGAFVNCFGLSEVHMPDTVTSIEGTCFYDEMTTERLDITIYGSRRYYPYQWAEEKGFDVVDTDADRYFILHEVIDEEAKTARITGIDGVAKDGLVIPSTIDGYTITEIADSAFNSVGTESKIVGTLTIPDTITGIGYNAFEDCDQITGDLVIPDSVTFVAPYAFSGCSGFNGTLTLSDNLIGIDANAFAGCSGFIGTLELPSALEIIDVNAFSGCSGFTGALVFPSKLETIGSGAFSGCSGFTGILSIPYATKNINDYAFFNCTGLEKINITPNTNENIADNAFTYDSVGEENDEYEDFILDIIIICEPDSYVYEWAKRLGYEVDTQAAFEARFTYEVLDDGTACITKYNGASCDYLEIPDRLGGYTVTQIGAGAFKDCTEIYGRIIVPETVKVIGDGAFEGVTGTDYVYLPDSLESLGEYVFRNCSNLMRVRYPETLNTIPDETFCGIAGYEGNTFIDQAEKLTIPEHIVTIGDKAYFNNSYLTRVVISDNVTSIGKDAFSKLDMYNNVINQEITFYCSKDSYAYDWALENGFNVFDISSKGDYKFTYEVMEDGSAQITGYEGTPGCNLEIPGEIDGYTVTRIADSAFGNQRDFTGTLTLPDTLVEIGSYAFADSDGLTGDLILPDNLKIVGEGAFSCCYGFNGKLILSESLECIGSSAFSDCRGLKGKLNIPDTVTLIGTDAFIGCEGFDTLQIGKGLDRVGMWAFNYLSGLKGTLIIPENIKVLEESAFANCRNLTDVFIPESVTEINETAFSDEEDYDDEDYNLEIRIHCIENSYAHTWAVEHGFDVVLGNSYEVTLETYGGTINAGNLTNYTEGIETTLPTDVTKEGYTFVGWYDNPEFSGKPITVIDKTQTGDLTFYTKWFLNEYQIEFVVNGGTIEGNVVTTYTVESESIVLPTNVTKEAYAFAGWYDNASFAGEKVTEIPTGSTGNKVFYAKWTAEIYSIKYHTNGGTLPEGTRTSYTVEFGTITFVNPTRKGYEFEGWYDNSACISGKVTEIPAASMGNVEIYAKWKPIVYSIEYVLNDDSLNIAEHPNPVTYTIETETFELTDASRRGYESFGWYSDEGCTKQISEIEKGTTGNLKVYAYWEPIPYDIEYVFNTDDYELDVDYDAEYTVEDEVVLVEPSRKGYDFAGWYLDESLKNSAGEKIAVNTIGDKVFYAKWTPTKYYITYDVDGGKTVTSTEYTIETNTFELPTTTKEGYKFLGWSYDENVLSEKVTTVEKGTVGNFTLYAHWEALEYSIEYNVNGGNEIADTVFTVESAAFDLQTPTRTGYDFAGWYTNSKFTGDPVTKIAAGSIGNKVFYAKWTAIKYCITYDVNGGNEVADTTFTVESATFDLPKATRAGYTFAGWYLEPECRTQITKVEKGKYTDSFTVYADWTENPYDITYVVNKGVLPEGAPATYGTSTGVEKLPEPTRRGYEFLGWYTTRNFRGEAIDSIAVGETGNKTIYANWERINYPICYELNDTEQDNNGDIISPATNAKGNPSTYHVESTTITLKAPTRDGYTFKGWYYWDMDQNQMVRIEKIVKGSFDHPLTLSCEWEPTEYNITYVLNGGAFETEVKKTYSIKDDTVVLAEPSRKGYEFAGWYTNAKFGEDYKVTEIEKRSTGNKTFYAKWAPIEYTIEYHNEDEISYANYTIESKAITLPVLKKAGYTFEGWYEAENGTGTPVTVIPAKSTEDKNFYAKWSLIEYTIEYHNAEIDDGIYTVASGVVTLPVLEREGYVFEGWYAAQNFKGESITEIAANSTGDKNFYAKWSLEKYAINCNLRADEKEVSFDFVLPETYDYETAVTLPEAYRFGYEFLGWFTKDENGNLKAIEVIESGNTGDIDIFAKWNWSVDFVTEINTKSLNIEDNESAIPTIIVPYGETVNVNMSLTAIQDGHAIGHYVQSEDIQIVIAKGLYDEVITKDDLNSEFTQNIINGSNGTGYDFEVNADKYVYVDENGNEVYYTVAMVISGADYDKLYAPYASFRVKEAPQPLPINDSIEWSGISSLETGLTYNKLVNPTEDDSMKHLDDLLEKLFANTDAETREELKTNGTLTFKGVKNTDAVLKSGTYTIEYNYNGTESYETSAEAALKINYGVFSAAGVQYKGLDSKETELDMIADAGAIACPVNGINATPYVSGVSIVPMFKTPWGDILTANELPKEEYDVSVRCVKVDKSKEVGMDTDLEFAYNNDSCDVEVTTKDINPTKTLTKTIYLETTIALRDDDTASIIIPTTIKNFKVYNGGSNAIESISWLREGDSKTEQDASSYLYPMDTAEARQVKFTFTVKDYAGDGVENMYGKVKWSTSNKAVATVSVDKTTGQPKITIPKKAQGVAEIKAVTTDAAKKEFSFRIVVADLGVRVENTKLTLNSKATESVGVVNVYPNVLAQSLPKDDNDQKPFSVKVEFVNKKGTEKDEIAETLFNVENMIEQSGEVMISFKDAQTLKKNHTTYLKVTQTIPGYGDVSSSPIKVTISDKCTPPTVSGKVTANYNKAMTYKKTFAEVLVTTAEPLSNEVDLNEALKLMDTKVGLITSNVKKVSDTQYRVELMLTEEIAETEFKNAKQFYVQFEALCAGYRVPSETKQIKVPIVNVAPTFELSSDTPMFYKDNEVEFRNVKINVKVPTDVTVENIELTKDALKQFGIVNVSNMDENLIEVTVRPNAKSSGGNVQFNITTAEYEKPLTSTKLKITGRTITSEAITLYDNNTNQKAANSFTFYYSLLGKERISLRAESQYLSEIVNTYDGEIEIDVQAANTATATLLNKKAVVVESDGENVVITATKDAFDSKLKKNTSCKLKIALIAKDGNNAKSTKVQNITLTFNPKSNNTSVTLKAAEKLNVAAKDTAVSVKPTIKYLPMGAIVEDITFKNPEDEQRFVIDKGENGAFTIKLAEGGVDVPSGKNTIAVTYDIRTVSGELTKVDTSVVVNVVQTAAIKSSASTLTLYNSVIGTDFGKFITFTESKFGGKISVEIDEASREMLKDAGIRIVEDGKESDYEGASDMNETVKYKVYVAKDLNRGQEKTYTVKAKVSLYNSATKKGVPTTYNTSFKVKLAK